MDSICPAIDELYERFGFDEVRVELSTRPDKSIGTDEQWEHAEGALREALERQGRDYEVSPGEGTFYGPKIDFHITDALGRSWQCGTCQLDFQMPERFDLTYKGADNAEHRPVMIHRALLGSMERFVGILIEHHGGRFPLWLAPVQADDPPGGRPPQRAMPPRSRRGCGTRACGAGRRPLRVGRQEDPRRGGRQGPLHARGRRSRAGGRARSRFAPTARGTSARCRIEDVSPHADRGRRISVFRCGAGRASILGRNDGHLYHAAPLSARAPSAVPSLPSRLSIAS